MLRYDTKARPAMAVPKCTARRSEKSPEESLAREDHFRDRVHQLDNRVLLGFPVPAAAVASACQARPRTALPVRPQSSCRIVSTSRASRRHRGADPDDVLAVDDALDQLHLDSRKAQVVMLRSAPLRNGP